MTSFNLNTSIQCIKINKKIILLAQCQTKYKTILHNKSLGQYYEADGGCEINAVKILTKYTGILKI